MALPGTVLANRVLKNLELTRKRIRLYTYARAKDRSYKIWGSFNATECERLVKSLKRGGALNPRIVWTRFGGGLYASGVRFEL